MEGDGEVNISTKIKKKLFCRLDYYKTCQQNLRSVGGNSGFDKLKGLNSFSRTFQDRPVQTMRRVNNPQQSGQHHLHFYSLTTCTCIMISLW